MAAMPITSPSTTAGKKRRLVSRTPASSPIWVAMTLPSVTGLWMRVSPMKRPLIQASPAARDPETRMPAAIAAATAVTRPERVSAVRLRRRLRSAAATSVSGQRPPSSRPRRPASVGASRGRLRATASRRATAPTATAAPPLRSASAASASSGGTAQIVAAWRRSRRPASSGRSSSRIATREASAAGMAAAATADQHPSQGREQSHHRAHLEPHRAGRRAHPEGCLQPGTQADAGDDPHQRPGDGEDQGLGRQQAEDLGCGRACGPQQADVAPALEGGEAHRVGAHPGADDHAQHAGEHQQGGELGERVAGVRTRVEGGHRPAELLVDRRRHPCRGGPGAQAERCQRRAQPQVEGGEQLRGGHEDDVLSEAGADAAGIGEPHDVVGARAGGGGQQHACRQPRDCPWGGTRAGIRALSTAI